MRGKAPVHLASSLACFALKVNNVCIIKISCSKLVSTRRSTVLSLPLQFVFLGSNLSENPLADKASCKNGFDKLPISQSRIPPEK